MVSRPQAKELALRTHALIARQDLPSCHDDTVENLQAKDFFCQCRDYHELDLNIILHFV